MDKWRDRSVPGPKKPSRFQKGRRDHPYVNQTLPYKNVYKTQTFIKAESGSRTGPFFRCSGRRSEHDVPQHKPDIKQQPYACLESWRSNREHYPGSRSRGHDFPRHKPVITQEPSTCQGDNFDWKRHILKFIVTDLQTPLLVEEDGFQNFLKALNPNIDYALSASAVRKELSSVYEATKRNVKKAVIDASDLVLSAELWLSSKKESYLTVTCHFIDRKWDLKSYTLETAHLLGEDTPEKVNEHLWRISREWDIVGKIQVVVVNVDKMKRGKLASDWTYIPCFSHTLNKVIQEVVESPDWRYLINKCRRIVQFFHQENEALWCPHLTQSSNGDWLSTLNMVSKICQQWPKFSQDADYKRNDLWLNENERGLLQNMNKVLTVVKNVMQEIGTCRYVPVSNIIPLIDKLQSSLQSLTPENNVASKLSERCKYHFGNINENMLFTVSTALDPRYKNSVLKTDKGEKVKAKIKEELGNRDCEALLLRYIVEKDVPATQNLLQYWAAQNNSKDLAKVAHKYLSVISTAIPIEQMMHENNSRIIFNRRKCLELEDMNMMLFLNANYQNI
ncbi:E3 SUMO-protein ligase ZBED1 [Clarias gariepinus]|uniref:E3 SUMO-protein ligase ZBED1 n=1 Tax=Clarias gariepinus TaxID=13013 RepID=UPI00234C8FEC|nr:E3 SUMO-protein ligase ZBED1 [Clarias gariepinus]